MADLWQTIEQAAVSLKMSVRTVNRHISAGKLQSRLSNEGRREVLVSLPDTPVADAAAPTDAAASQTAASVGQSSAEPNPFSNTPMSFDPDTVLALADNVTKKADLAVTAYQTLARAADIELRKVHRQVRVAWSALALAVVGVVIAVGWTTHHLTQSKDEIAKLSDQLEHEKTTVDDLSAEQKQLRDERLQAERSWRDELSRQTASVNAERTASELSLRNELTAARETAAEAQGALKAYQQLVQAREVEKKNADVVTDHRTAAAAAPTTRPSDDTALSSTDLAKPASAVIKADVEELKATTRPSVTRHKLKAPTSKPSNLESSSSPIADEP